MFGKSHLIIVLIVLIVANFFALYPFSVNLKDSTPDNPDDVLLNSYIMKWEYQRILSLDFKNYFHTTYYYPYSNTLSFTEHHTISQLFFIPLYTLLKDEVLVHNIILLLLLVFNGLVMYIFIKHITDSFIAGFVAAILFTFVPYRYTHLVHLNVLHWWTIPFAFLSFYIFSKRVDYKSAIIFGVSLLCVILWSNNITAFFIVPFGLYFLFTIFKERLWLNKRFYSYVILVFTLVFLISLPFILPYLRLREEMFFERFLFDIRYYSPQLKNFLGVHKTNLLWGELLKDFGKWECYLFPGAVFLLLFVISIFISTFNKKHRGQFIFFIILAFISFILSLGPYIDGLKGEMRGPYYLLWKYVPGYYGIRVPSRFAIFMYFSMSTAIGLSIAGIISKLSEKRYTKIIYGVIILLLSLFYVYEGSHRIEIHKPLNHPEKDPIYQKIKELPFGVVFEFPAFMAYKDAAQTFASLYYNKPTYNGYSGWKSKPLENLYNAVKNYSPTQLVNILRDAYVRYFILRGYVPSSIYDRVIKISEYSKDVKKIFQTNRDVIFEIENPKLSELDYYRLNISDAKIFFPQCIKPDIKINGGLVLKLDENHYYISKRRRYPTKIELFDSQKKYLRDINADVIAYQIYENGYIHFLIKSIFPQMEGNYYIRLKGADNYNYVRIRADCNIEQSESIEISDFIYSDVIKDDEPLKIGFNIKNNSKYLKAAVDIDDFTTDGVFRTAVFIEGLEDENKDIRYEFKYPLYSDMSAGDMIYFEKRIPVFLKAGKYKLRVDFVSEKRFWFSQKIPVAQEKEFTVEKSE